MSALSEVSQWWAKTPVRLVIAAVAFAAVTVITVLIARYQLFTLLQPYEDEGYMLVALKSFVHHGSLYDYVFTQYGPFFYDFWGGIFSLFGIPVTQSSGRIATLVVWVVVSLGLGLTTAWICRSLLLGLGVQAATFASLTVLINEPMHPGGLICLLLMALLAVACFMRERLSLLPAALLGGTVAALILVKINVGAFALVSVALVCVLTYPALASRRWIRIPVELFFVALPFLLMAGDLGEAWASHYAVHVAAASLAVVIVLRARELPSRSDEELWWLVGGFVAVGLAACLAIVGSGTSVSGLIEGVIRQPLRQGDAFTIPLGLANRTYLFDALAVLGAIGYLLLRRRELGRGWVAAGSVLIVAIGAEMALSLIGKAFLVPTSVPGYEFAFLGFAWLALIPSTGEERSVTFARLFLPVLAVLQALHAYPVAGSQSFWATFLLIPVGVICIGTGVRQLLALIPEENGRYALGALAAAAGVVALGLVGNVTLREPLNGSRDLYASRVPLNLPGSGRVRLAPEEVDRYRAITNAIEANCASLLELPGMGNFYIWSEQEPPTGFVATAWPTLFDDAHQERVVEQTRSIPNLCLLRNQPLAEGWSAGPVPQGPLVAYLEDGFRPVFSRDGYELLRRENPLQ